MYMKTKTLCSHFDCSKPIMLRIIRGMHANIKYRRYVMPPKRRGQPWRANPEAVERYIRE